MVRRRAGGRLDRCAPGPSVPRRTRAERRGAAATRQRHGARVRARGQRAAERAPTARAPRAPLSDMDALSDDDEYARREAQVCLRDAPDSKLDKSLRCTTMSYGDEADKCDATSSYGWRRSSRARTTLTELAPAVRSRPESQPPPSLFKLIITLFLVYSKYLE